MSNELMHIKLCRVIGDEQISALLEDFKYIFPHLEDRKNNLSDYAKKLNKYGKVYCAKSNNTVFGMVALYDNNKETKEAFIALIGIKDEYRHKGLGTELMISILEVLKSEGMKSLKLEVDNCNLHAIDYYKRNGFILLCAAGDDSSYMTRKI